MDAFREKKGSKFRKLTDIITRRLLKVCLQKAYSFGRNGQPVIPLAIVFIIACNKQVVGPELSQQ